MSNGQIVPFGKYKGRQVEEMVADRQYCDWLQAQPWFGERFPQMRVLIMNVGQEPQDTPEHNEMQARFLDPAYCIRLWWALNPHAQIEEAKAGARGAIRANVDACAKQVERALESVSRTEEYRKDAELRRATTGPFVHGDPYYARMVDESDKKLAKARADLAEAEALLVDCEKWISEWPKPSISPVRFEVSGWDVVYRVTYGPASRPMDLNIFGFSTPMLVECKPVIGDDYPAVLRQVLKRNITDYTTVRVVFADKVQTSNVPFDQVRTIFASQSVVLIDNSRLAEPTAVLMAP